MKHKKSEEKEREVEICIIHQNFNNSEPKSIDPPKK